MVSLLNYVDVSLPLDHSATIFESCSCSFLNDCGKCLFFSFSASVPSETLMWSKGNPHFQSLEKKICELKTFGTMGPFRKDIQKMYSVGQK